MPDRAAHPRGYLRVDGHGAARAWGGAMQYAKLVALFIVLSLACSACFVHGRDGDDHRGHDDHPGDRHDDRR
jgi:hypothetical protein